MSVTDTEKVVLIIYRLEQDRYTDNEIGLMYNVHPRMVKGLRQAAKIIRSRMYRRV